MIPILGECATAGTQWDTRRKVNDREGECLAASITRPSRLLSAGSHKILLARANKPDRGLMKSAHAWGGGRVGRRENTLLKDTRKGAAQMN